jgi:hypothetical protein
MGSAAFTTGLAQAVLISYHGSIGLTKVRLGREMPQNAPLMYLNIAKY